MGACDLNSKAQQWRGASGISRLEGAPVLVLAAILNQVVRLAGSEQLVFSDIRDVEERPEVHTQECQIDPAWASPLGGTGEPGLLDYGWFFSRAARTSSAECRAADSFWPCIPAKSLARNWRVPVFVKAARVSAASDIRFSFLPNTATA
jgi:hypothetical protein